MKEEIWADCADGSDFVVTFERADGDFEFRFKSETGFPLPAPREIPVYQSIALVEVAMGREAEARAGRFER